MFFTFCKNFEALAGRDRAGLFYQPLLGIRGLRDFAGLFRSYIILMITDRRSEAIDAAELFSGNIVLSAANRRSAAI